MVDHRVWVRFDLCLFWIAILLTWLGLGYKRTKAPRGTPLTRDPYGTTGRWFYLPTLVAAGLAFAAGLVVLVVQ